MILLISHEAVILEMLQSARALVAGQLQIPLGWVTVRLEREKRMFRNPRVFPVIELTPPSEADPLQAPLARELRENPPDTPFFTLPSDQVRDIVSKIGSAMSKELMERLAGIDA